MFSGVFLRFPAEKCFPVFLVTGVYWIILVCVLSDRSIEGKPQRTFLLNRLDNIIIQASYILVDVILHGQQK